MFRGSRRGWRRLLPLLVAAVLLAASFPGAAAAGAPGPSGSRGPAGSARLPIHVRGAATAQYQAGYTPAQIRHAYGFDTLGATGAGQTIAIVDAYGSPTIQQDLATFDQQFGLPPAQLTIAYPGGKPRKTDGGWALETSLDVEWAHALAPGARILLVVARTASLSDLLQAVDYASGQGAQVVSMSWGGSEFSGETSYDATFTRSGVVYVASSGDSGTGTLWPAVSPDVVGVGGTTLPLDAQGDLTGPESAWAGSGGGTSLYEPEPGYQVSYGIDSGGARAVPDVSFDADPNTGVAVYDSTRYQGQSGWYVVGGTSFGAPSWAALVALADESRTAPLAGADSLLYQLATGALYAQNYRDVLTGSNGSCGSLCTAGPGYDFVTGLGSPLAGSLVPALAAAP
ncbi:MAG: S53 family peptidase [Bacillota bacterium]|nr:S53 family peptidase [Bacillota bacterium]